MRPHPERAFLPFGSAIALVAAEDAGAGGFALVADVPECV